MEMIGAAEKFLLTALDLADWQPPEPLTYTRRAADVFSAERIDAEYFHPEKKYALDVLGKSGGPTLGEIVSSVRDMYDPSAASAGELVRNFDLTDALQPELTDEMPPARAGEIGSLKKTMHAGDVAISRLRAYLREIAIVRTSSAVPTVGSSEFVVLRPKNQDALSAGALLVFLRSYPVQAILKWCRDGSQHPRFDENDLLAIPVPKQVWKVSAELDRLVNEAFAARQHAHELLERAKRAVEIAIEHSEAEAISQLKGA